MTTPTPRPPKIWHYAVAFVLLLPLWVIILLFIIQPKELMHQPSIPLALGYYLLPPALLTICIYIIRSAMTSAEATRLEETQKAEEARAAREAEEAEKREQARLTRQRFTLEIRGVGLSIGNLRTAEIFENIQEGSILELLEEEGESEPEEERMAWVLDDALGDLMEGSPLPVWITCESMPEDPVPACPFLLNGERLDHRWMKRLWEAQSLMGRSNPMRIMDICEAPQTENALTDIFAFIDENPEVPAVLLLGINETPQSEGLDEDDEETACTYSALLIANPPAIESMRQSLPGSHENALTPFWDRKQPQKPFTPTQYVPAIWSHEQLDTLEALPRFAKLHRPSHIEFVSEIGPMKDRAKVDVFFETWNACLERLPEGVEPSKIVFGAPKGKASRIVPMTQAFMECGFEIDLFKEDEGLDLTQNLGDLQSATWMAGITLAALDCHEQERCQVISSFAMEDQASLVAISPVGE